MSRLWKVNTEGRRESVTLDELIEDSTASDKLSKDELEALRAVLTIAVNNAPTAGYSLEFLAELRRKLRAVWASPAVDHAHIVGHEWH